MGKFMCTFSLKGAIRPCWLKCLGCKWIIVMSAKALYKLHKCVDWPGASMCANLTKSISSLIYSALFPFMQNIGSTPFSKLPIAQQSLSIKTFLYVNRYLLQVIYAWGHQIKKFLCLPSFSLELYNKHRIRSMFRRISLSTA